jgi:tyrosine-protein phosphatase SIW14
MSVHSTIGWGQSLRVVVAKASVFRGTGLAITGSRRIERRLNQTISYNSSFWGCNVRLIAGLARTSTAAVLVTLSLVSSVAAGTVDARSNASATGTSTIQIDNFGRVDPNYYRGAQPQGNDYANLAALGVKTVINLASDDAEPNEKSMTEHAGMQYVQIPMTTHQPPTAAQLAQFLRIVDDPASQPVYVHCVGGRHRTGVMTAAYRMTDGWTADQAFKEMKQYKFGADFLHSEFKDFVYAYHPGVVHALASPSNAMPATTTGISNR